MDKEKVAERLKLIRERLNYSQAGMADLAGVSQRTFSSWESGVLPMQWAAAVELAEAAGVSTGYLLGLTDEPTGARRDLSEDEVRLLGLWRALSPTRRRDLVRVGELWQAEESKRAENLAQATALTAAIRSALVERHGEIVGEQLYQILLNGDRDALLNLVEQGSQAI